MTSKSKKSTNAKWRRDVRENLTAQERRGSNWNAAEAAIQVRASEARDAALRAGMSEAEAQIVADNTVAYYRAKATA